MESVLATRYCVSVPLHIAGYGLKAQQKLCMREYLPEGHFQDVVVSKLIRNIGQASQGQINSQVDLDMLVEICAISNSIDITSAASGRGHANKYTMDGFTCSTYSNEEALDVQNYVFASTSSRLSESFCSINDQPKFSQKATSKLDQQHAKRPQPRLDELYSEIADIKLRIVLMLLTKLWLALQSPSSASDPKDGSDNASRNQQRGYESNKNRVGNPESSNPMSSQESCKTGQKRSRQSPRTPGSEEEDDEDDEDDEDPKKPGAGGVRGRGPRKLNEFGCPFFKHDPQTHGGRGGCREYSHISVSILMRDHIGIKHLRNNDLDETTWLELKQTKHRQGAARYKEIYAKLFPGDEAGIINPYFVEYPLLPTTWSDRAPHLRAAEFVTAAMQFLESITRIEEERSEKEAQIRSRAEVNLRQVQTELESQWKQLKASAAHKEVQIRSTRDEQLERLGSEMSQRRQAIRARLEAIIQGGPSSSSAVAGVGEDSTNPGTPSAVVEADLLHLVSTHDRTQSITGETEMSEWDRSSHSNLGDRTVAQRRSISSFVDWTS